jgi:SPX domain protein involved in polyphosphate accumulation
MSKNLWESRRYSTEIKFLTSPAQADEIRLWARAHLDRDLHGSGDMGDNYRITSIYYDTDKFDVYHRNRSFGRSKYRVRRYGDSDVAFLERKMKSNKVVCKRRSSVAVDELNRLKNEMLDEDWIGFWFHRRLLARKLKPICQISYLRTARVYMTNYGPVRLTLDQDLKVVAPANLDFSPAQEGMALLPDHIILEMKYNIEMPALFKILIEQFNLSSHAFSKYRLAVKTLGYVKKPSKSGRAEAFQTTAYA